MCSLSQGPRRSVSRAKKPLLGGRSVAALGLVACGIGHGMRLVDTVTPSKVIPAPGAESRPGLRSGTRTSAAEVLGSSR
jgi:hypothetical protein